MNPYIVLAVMSSVLGCLGYWWGHRAARKRILKCVFVRCRYKEGSKAYIVFALGPFKSQHEKERHISELRKVAGEDVEFDFTHGREISLAFESGSNSEPPEEYFPRMRQGFVKYLWK